MTEPDHIDRLIAQINSHDIDRLIAEINSVDVQAELDRIHSELNCHEEIDRILQALRQAEPDLQIKHTNSTQI